MPSRSHGDGLQALDSPERLPSDSSKKEKMQAVPIAVTAETAATGFTFPAGLSNKDTVSTARYSGVGA